MFILFIIYLFIFYLLIFCVFIDWKYFNFQTVDQAREYFTLHYPQYDVSHLYSLAIISLKFIK